MNNKFSITIVTVFLLLVLAVAGCGTAKPDAGLQTTATVQRGDLAVKVIADCSVEMPAAVSLYFDTSMFTSPYSTIIRKMYVKKGDLVRQGSMLAKLDDKTQKLAVEAAQYNLELAINNLVQTCSVDRSASYYVDAIAWLRFQSAFDEVKDALVQLGKEKYLDVATAISLARYDLEATRSFYTDPKISRLRAQLYDVDQLVAESNDFSMALKKLAEGINSMILIQGQLQQGKYQNARDSMISAINSLEETQLVIKRLNRLRSLFTYSDTATTFTMINEVLGELDALQKLIEQKDFDLTRFSEKVRLAKHDLEITSKILDENVDTFVAGVNLKVLRDYNINIHNATINLERAKEVLLRTELMAPFDGMIMDINLSEGDMITQRYAVTGLPMENYIIRIASTKAVRITGVIDEIDAAQILQAMKPGNKPDAIVSLDAYPGQQFKGQVVFVSALGALQAGVANYKVEIELGSSDAVFMAGGMTATAEILVDKHENVLLVPNGAVKGTPGNYWVEVLPEGKNTEKRPVTTGLRNRSQTEIISGLLEGERVALDNARPQPKQPISLK